MCWLLSGDRYAELLKLVDNPFRRGPPKIPQLYKVISGRPETDSEALQLVNRVMVDWVLVYKKVRIKEGECPYYSPSSTMTAIRSLFAYLGKACGWVIAYNDLKGFDGCLDAVLENLFDTNQETYVSTTYF